MIREDRLQPGDHRRVAEFVGAQAGIQLPEHKRSLIETRLRRRVKATGHATFRAYLDFALSPAGRDGEQVLLIDELTTNKTDFFREPGHFNFLNRYVAKELAPHSGPGFSRPLKVWSAACSTGEEPYTLAMVFREIQEEYRQFEFTIDATDIAPSVLEIARKGVYPLGRVAPVSQDLRKKYLLKSRDPEKGLVRVDRATRSTVHFYSFNLITGKFPEKPTYDVIFCRNVMIYFNNEDREKIIRQLRALLRPGGLLFIGHSESIGSQRAAFETLMPTVFRRLD